jgi:hypothetical protein
MNELSLAEFDLDGIHKQILNSIEDMLNCLEDRQTNLAVEEKFDLSENRKICERCNYVRICPR